MLFLIFLCSFSGLLTTAFFLITLPYTFLRVSQVVLVVRNLPANAGDIRETGSILGWEDPLEEEVATHSSMLAWRIWQIEKPGGVQSTGSYSSLNGCSPGLQKSQQPQIHHLCLILDQGACTGGRQDTLAPALKGIYLITMHQVS